MMSAEVQRILSSAEERLKTAYFGLDDLRGRPQRRRSGFYNGVVFGRMVTLALQNLRGKVTDFDCWYTPWQKKLSEDSLFRYFKDARNAIEKQAESKLENHAHIISLNTSNLDFAYPAPPGAVGMFIGDRDGASGWMIQREDGKEDKYYFDLPAHIGTSNLMLHAPPSDIEKYGKAFPADAALELYLNFLGTIVEDAKSRFGS